MRFILPVAGKLTQNLRKGKEWSGVISEEADVSSRPSKLRQPGDGN